MNADVATRHIRALMKEARDAGYGLKDDGKLTFWNNRGHAILSRALGADHRLTKAFTNVIFYPMSFWEGMPQSEYIEAFQRGITSALAHLESAIFELELVSTSDDAVDSGAFDQALWRHVQGHVEAVNGKRSPVRRQSL